jgi:acyl carrier protein
MKPSSENGLPPQRPPRLEDVRALILSASGAPLSDPEAVIAGASDDLDLRDSGVIDSLGFIELVAAVEEALGIEIEFEAIDPDQITILGSLARHVHAQAEAAAGGTREE